MRRSTLLRTFRLFAALLLFAGAFSAPSPAGAEVIRRAVAGSEVLGAQLALSGNGRFLLRMEESGGTVCNTVRLPTLHDIVVYDLETSSAECITVDTAGAGVSGSHSLGSISGDGQLVVFTSSANGLDPRCPGGIFSAHVFLRNRITRRTECISITEAGTPGNAPSVTPVISANGNLIAFWSTASNLTPGKTDNASVLLVVRVVAGARSGAISQVAQPSTADHTIGLSADGRFVMFPSSRPNPAGGPALISDFFRHDLVTGETIPVAVSATGAVANGLVGSPAALSADGRFATFTSVATNLVPGITASIRQLYRRDLQTGEVLLVSRGWAGVPGNIEIPLSAPVSMSADGRFAVFSSDATNLVPNDINARSDVFVAELSTGTSLVTRLSVATDGVTEADGGSEWGASISAGGGLVAFASRATNLDPDSPGSGVFLARIPPALGPVLTGPGHGGGPHVRSLFTGGVPDPARDFFAYDGSFDTFDAGVTVARGDIDNDGVPDIVTGTGPGGPPVVNVYSGAISTIFPNGRLYPKILGSFLAYDLLFRGGVTVAVADVTGDGIVDIITGAGPGGGPHVRVFQALAASAFGPMTISEYASFFAYDPAFRGGVRVGAGDLDGNGVSEILTAAGPGGSPHVQAFVLNAAHQPETVLSFFAYNPAFMGGVFVAAGDVDGDGREELITGADAGGSPHVRVFGTGPAFTGLREVYSFFAYEPGFTGGVRVAAGDLDADGAAEIITAPGPWHTPVVRVFHRDPNGALDRISSFYAYDPAFSAGVFVAAPH